MSSGGKSAVSKSQPPVAPGTPPQRTFTPAIRVQGSPARAVISTSPVETIDATHAITGALAHCLWQLRGGQDIANWVDAENLTKQLLSSLGTSPPASIPEVVVRKRAKSRSR